MSDFGPIKRQLLRGELEMAVQAIAERYGVELAFEPGKASNIALDFKVEFAMKGKQEMVAKQLGNSAERVGLPANVIGKTFINKTKHFTVTGINLRRPANPVELEDTTGKKYKCSVRALKSMAAI